MPKVSLPRASWDLALECLKDRSVMDWPRDPAAHTIILIKEIEDQLYGQEG